MSKRKINRAIFISLPIFFLFHMTPTYCQHKTNQLFNSIHVNANQYRTVETLTVSDNLAYAGVEDELVVLSVSGSENPIDLNHVTIESGKIENIVLKDNNAFVAAGGAGLIVMDASNPADLQIIASLPTQGYAESVDVRNELAYVADGGAGIRIIDVSDPASANEIGFCYVTGYAFDVQVDGNYAYVAGGGGGLLVVDVSDSFHPTEVGICNTPGYTYGLDVASGMAYLADGWEGFRIIDISNPHHPIEIGAYKTPGWAFDVDAEDGRAFVADAFAGIRILDVSNTHRIEELGAFEDDADIHSLSVKDGIILAADRRNGVRVIDISNTEEPISSGLCRLGDVSSIGGFERPQDTRVLRRNYLQPHLKRASIPPRNPEYAETFEFTPIGQYGGQIKAIDVDGNHAYVGVGLRIEVLDITDRTKPYAIGATSILDGFVTDVQMVSDRLFVTLDKGGLSVIDISDPTQPDEIGYTDLPGYSENIDISEHYAYIASGGAGLRVVDISDPEHPEEVGFAYTDGYAHDVIVRDETAFMAGTGSGLRIVDVSDPENPHEMSGYDTPGFARSLTVRDNTVFMTDGKNGLSVIDVSDEEQPEEIVNYELPGFALHVVSDGMTAYVTTSLGLFALDITDPASILSLGAFQESGMQAVDVTISQNTAFIADGFQRLRLIDMTDLSAPVQISYYETMGYASSVEIVDNYALIATGSSFDIIDISDLTKPKRVYSYVTGSGTDDLALFDSYVYMQTLTDGHFIFDISTPSEPVFVASFECCDGFSQYIVVYEEKIYHANEAGLVIIDVSDPSKPFLAGYIALTEGMSGQFETNAVAVSGNLAYVTLGGWGLKIVDVSDPDHLFVVGVFQDTHNFTDLVVVGDRAYVCSRHLWVLDVSDPSHPTQLGICYDIPSAPSGIIVSGEIAYLSVAKNGLVAVDVSDPSDMTIVGEYNTPGSTRNVTLRDSLVYCADGEAGFLILKKMDTSSQKLENTSQSTDALIVTNTGDTGTGSLRDCMNRVLPGQTITFDAEVFSPSHPDTISLTSVLPPITQGYITLDASNTGVVIDGHQLTQGSGMKIDSDQNRIQGLQILNFPEHGIDISGNDNMIGGDRSIGEGNVTSGNSGNGIFVSGKHNTIQGNYCGTDDLGANMLGNELSGVVLAGDSNRVGGLGPSIGQRNVISGNSVDGISIFSNHNVVVNNLIGTDVTGTFPLGNGTCGIFLEESYNIIGGNLAWERNLISGNGVDGIRNEFPHNTFIGNYIGTDITGSIAVGNHDRGFGTERMPYNVIIENNLISGNIGSGIVIHGSYNQMTGNIIGLDATGAMVIKNSTPVLLFESFNRLGGSSVGEKNIISGNENGIGIQGRDQIVIGNNIGTDASGKFLIGNGRNTIVCGGNHNFFGGAAAEEGNIISGDENGLEFYEGKNYFVAGNSIGCDPANLTGIGDLRIGIDLFNCSDNYIGPGNRIMHCEEGIRVIGHYSEENTISRNSITQNDIGIRLLQGGNKEIAPPSITDFTTSSVSGTTVLNSIVEIFADPEDEGMLYEGTVKSDGLGNFTFTIAKGLAGPNVTATVTDMDGNTSEFSGEVQGVNDRPFVIQSINDVILPEDFGNQLVVSNLYGFFADTPPETLLVFSACSRDSLTIPSVQNDSLIIQSVLNAWGEDEIVVTATDVPGLSVQDTFNVTIPPLNDPPEFNGLPDTVSFASNETDTVFFWEYVEDPETSDSLLAYKFTPGYDSLNVHYDSSSGFLTLSAQNGYYGLTNLFISVTDDSGAMASDSLLVDIFQSTGIENSDQQIPLAFKLYQNYPNPFNPTTTVEFDLSRTEFVTLKIYNILGEEVATLVSKKLTAGNYKYEWDAGSLASGIYFYHLEAGKDFRKTKKLVLLK
jgi:hypothetical protein